MRLLDGNRYIFFMDYSNEIGGTIMVIDFSRITIYEVLALGLSLIAILIPIIQWVWKKFIVKPELKHYPTGRAYLFINRSGSYIRFEGVFEALKKSISIRNVNLKIVRKKDEKVLNLTWSVFISPVNQQIVGAYSSVSEIAHPFRIEADSVGCAFIEFSDFYEAAAKTLRPYFDNLEEAILEIDVGNKSYKEAYKEFIALNEYGDIKKAIEQELFWIISEYEMMLEAEYGEKKVTFNYYFDVTNENMKDLKHNMDETIALVLKSKYRIPSNYKVVQVQVKVK